MRIQYAAILATILSAIPLALTAQQTATNVNLTSVTILGRRGEQLRLQRLAESAFALVQDRFPETRTNASLRASAYIDFSGNEPEVRFAIVGRPGERWFRVSYSLAGEVRKCESRAYEHADLMDQGAAVGTDRAEKDKAKQH